nr:HAMP domain-containing sensor histidine kinase [uncultured Sphingomonas sp.]
MIVFAALWIGLLLLGGGYALDRSLQGTLTSNFDEQLNQVLNSMIGSSEIGPDGEVRFSRAPADQRYVEAYSGAYFQITDVPANHCQDQSTSPLCYPSRSLWDRRLTVNSTDTVLNEPRQYDSNEFDDEPLRIVERDVILPGSETRWRFQVAQSREILDTQIHEWRKTLTWSFAGLAIGLMLLAVLQAFYGLWPLRSVRREVAAIRGGTQTRIAEGFPQEVEPLVDEINELLSHNENQAEEARRHAGNLAHALKTPLTVITNSATAHSDDLAETVIREAAVMRRQVDHHLARARAIGRRSAGQSRALVWESVCAVERAVSRMYDGVTIDIAGDKQAQVRVERQDLDEMLGNLVENAAKYGGGRVFVTVEAPSAGVVSILIEDDGTGIAKAQRDELFERGKRLDTTGKPGTGLGLAIVRDVAEIYGGSVSLGESEDLGGLLVTLSLPAAG